MDAIEFATKAWAERFDAKNSDIELHEEVLINSFFRALRTYTVKDNTGKMSNYLNCL